MKNYDIAVIGSGPGGYVAALYASRHKLNTCVIERGLVGGTCLNRGCVPTKAMLNSASIVSTIKNAAIHGIDVEKYRVDFGKIAGRKDEVVSHLRAGIETLFRANKIDLIKGAARFESSDTLGVNGDSIRAKHIIVAAGSIVSELPGMRFDHSEILSSDDILELRQLPKSLIIIGGGVIGCEFANLFNALGAKVTIVEFLDRLVASQSREASKKLELVLKKRGVDVYTSSKAESATGAGLLKVNISGGKTVEAEKLLVSVGRRPNTEGLGLEDIGVKAEKGRVVVDDHLNTGIGSIYAVGDCVAGPLLAHKASYDGMLAVGNILGDKRRADYSNVPNCIWTDPQIASVGMCEEEAKAKFPDAKAAKFPYLGSGKACIGGHVEGFVKIIGDARGVILGVEIFGHAACDLIGEATLARTAGVNIRDWARVVHGHPTLSEIFQEAAHVFCGTPIHSV